MSEMNVSGSPDGVKQNRRGGQKRRGGVAHRRRQEAYAAAQQMKMSAPLYSWNGSCWETVHSPPLPNATHVPHHMRPPQPPMPPPSSHPPPSRPRRKIEPLRTDNLDAGDMGSNLPMTPSLAALTPRTQALTIGQILLARALVSDALGEYDNSPLSHKSLAPAATPRVHATRASPKSANTSEGADSISPSVEGLAPTETNSPPPPPPPPRTPPAVVLPAKAPPMPSPNSARKLSKEEFQALINARVKRSVSERAAALAAYNASAEKAQVDAERAQANQEAATLTRFSAVYRTPSGQAIRFDPPKNPPRKTPTKAPPPPPAPSDTSAGAAASASTNGGGGSSGIATSGSTSVWGLNETEQEEQRLRNTPPTPRFGAGKSIQHAAEVQWSFYEAVHPKQPQTKPPPPAASSSSSTADHSFPGHPLRSEQPFASRQGRSNGAGVSEGGAPSAPGLAPPPQWGPHNGAATSASWYGAAKSLSPPAGQRLDHHQLNSSSSGRVLSSSAPPSRGAPGFSRWSSPDGSGITHAQPSRQPVASSPLPSSLPSSPPMWPVAPVHAQAALAKRTIWDPSWGAELPRKPPSSFSASEKTGYDVAAAAAEALFSSSSLSSSYSAPPPPSMLSSSLGQLLAGNLSAPSPHSRPSADLGTDLGTGIGWGTGAGSDLVDDSRFEGIQSTNSGKTPRSGGGANSKAVGRKLSPEQGGEPSMQGKSEGSAALPVPKNAFRFGTPSPREQSIAKSPYSDGSENDTVSSDDDDNGDDGEFEIQFGFGF